PDQMLGIFMTELHRDQRAPVPTLSRELLVAKHILHERYPQVCGPREIDARGSERCGKPKPRERWHHHIEGVLRITTERRRISQRTDHFVKIPERPRPAMGQNQRDRLGTLTQFMDEVDWYGTDCGFIMGESIHLFFMLAPVIRVAPVVNQLHE